MSAVRAVILCALVVTGCAPTSPPATFTEVYAAMFPLHTPGQCNYCHNRPPNDLSNGMLDTGDTRAAAYAALVGPRSTSAMCGGDGYALVVPGSPETSLLYLKVAGSPPCGEPMPQGGSALPEAQVEMIRSWIAAGAHDD